MLDLTAAAGAAFSFGWGKDGSTTSTTRDLVLAGGAGAEGSNEAATLFLIFFFFRASSTASSADGPDADDALDLPLSEVEEEGVAVVVVAFTEGLDGLAKISSIELASVGLDGPAALDAGLALDLADLELVTEFVDFAMVQVIKRVG